MFLTKDEERILDGENGHAAQKSMQILLALGDIFGADKLIPVSSVQIAGVSYHNLGDAGLKYLSNLAKDGKVCVPTFLNPAGMDLLNWERLGISKEFAEKQTLVIDAFAKMEVTTTCTCTPYLIGIVPKLGEHIAWAESSAVTYANSILGARTNREGGPSAIASALTGKTPNYGLHLTENRAPDVLVKVEPEIKSIADWGALGFAIGKRAKNQIPYIIGPKEGSLDCLKSFGASIVTFGSKPMYHLEGLTPEAKEYLPPKETLVIGKEELNEAFSHLNDKEKTIDFVSLGCPHASMDELRNVASLLDGKKIDTGVTMWVSCARPILNKAKEEGLVDIIEASGAMVCADTCMAVAPLKGRFKSIATTSAKGCFYTSGHNNMKTHIGSLEECVNAALTGKWN